MLNLIFKLMNFLEIRLRFIMKNIKGNLILVLVLDYVDQHYQVDSLILVFHLFAHHLVNDDLKP